MNIRELLDSIKLQDLVLPEFQREYVWTKEDAKQLMVSLYKKYPTGSLLFWKTNNPPELKNTQIPEDKIGTTSVILDGQQRLTTLYLLMRNDIPPYYKKEEIFKDPRNLYFNIYTTDFTYYKPTMKDNPSWISVISCFKEPSPNPIKIAQELIESGLHDYDPMDLANHLQDNLNNLKQIQSEIYPIQTVPVSADVDEAIDIFDRVNSQGTKLTDADLALAHICGKWPQARQIMKRKIEKLKEYDFNFDLVFMTRALTGVVRGRSLFETIHDTPTEDLKEGWKKLSRILDFLVNLLPANAHIDSTSDLSSTNILVPVIVYLANNGMKFKDKKDMNQFIHWIYAAHMWSRYASQTDQKLDQDISIVLKSNNPHEKLIATIVDMRGRIEVKSSDILGRMVQNPFFNMAYIASKANGALDWYDGTPLGKSVGDSYNFHKHHIFASSLLYEPRGPYFGGNYEDKKLVNEIANRALITRNSNFKISNKPPSDYLPEIDKKFPGELENQFIPTEPELWKMENYEEFLIKRRELIANGINELMNKLLIDEPEKKKSVLELIDIGENEKIEFKSTLVWDIKEGKVTPKIEKNIAKSIAGFMNAEGGTLLVGVIDDGSIYGIEDDLSVVFKHNIDGFQLRANGIIKKYLGTKFGKYVHIDFEEVENKTVCIITVDKGFKPVYLKDKGVYTLYVRMSSSTEPLKPPEDSEYIQEHFKPS